MEAQRVTDIVEADAMGELGMEQRDNMTPSAEGPDFLVNAGFPGELGNKKIGNEVANLAQHIQFERSWNGLVLLFPPCLVAGRSKSFQLFPQFPWDGCDSVSPIICEATD